MEIVACFYLKMFNKESRILKNKALNESGLKSHTMIKFVNQLKYTKLHIRYLEVIV